MSEVSATPALPAGLIIELVTPLTATGSLDAEGLGRLVDWVAPYAAGIVAGSPGLGEALGLPDSLRQELLSRLIELWPGPGPLFFGVTADTREKTWDLIQELEAAGQSRYYDYQVYWLDLPLWYHSNRGLPAYYQQLLTAVKHPLVLLNQPDFIQRRSKPWKHPNLRTAVFKKLTALPEIKGLIFRGEMSRFLNYHRAALSRPDFVLYEGNESRFLSRPGSHGLVSAGAQLFPAAWREVTRACQHPEDLAQQPSSPARLWQLSTELLRLAQCYESAPVALLKTALQELRVIKHDTTCPATIPAAAGAKKNFLEALTNWSI
ncbi:MAG: dihydrodipicolinate synthase family protein [Desulfobacca sp.]|nr:dihydrodipicolinate synthase family protein [Desulfobacca sp.]